MRNLDGPSSRFRSCFFILKPEVLLRSSFTYGSSHLNLAEKGTIDDLDAVLAALLDESFSQEFALGVSGIRPPELVQRITGLISKNGMDARVSRNLDHFIATQVHGPVRLALDVEELVVDPSFKGTQTWQDLEEISELYKFPLRNYPGFDMNAANVPSDFRGPTMPPLAARITSSTGGLLDAKTIGSAVRQLHEELTSSSDETVYAESLQDMKLLWHVLVRYRTPLDDVAQSI